MYNVRRLTELPIPQIEVDQNENRLRWSDSETESDFEENTEISENSNDPEANESIASDQSDTASNENVLQNSRAGEGQTKGNNGPQNGEDNNDSEASIAQDENVIEDASVGVQNDGEASIDTSVQQAIGSNSSKENCDTQNDETIDGSVAIELNASGESNEHVADENRTRVAKTIHPENENAPTDNNVETAIEEIFVTADMELDSSESDETEIHLSNSERDETQMVDPIKTEPIPLHEPIQANNVELNEILDEEDMITEQLDDDITVIIDSKIGFGKPLNSNADGLIKRQNDIISGDIPFIQTVSKIESNKFSYF